VTVRALILVGLARLAVAQQPADPADDVDSAQTTTADRADALAELVRRIGARAFPEIVLHLFDPEAEVRARAAELLVLMGDPDRRARGRLEALAQGTGVDAEAARATIAALYGRVAPPGPAQRRTPAQQQAAWKYPALEPELPGDAALLSTGSERSIIPPFDAATTAGEGRLSMDLQLGEVSEMALRLGLHPRVDVGARLLIHPEDLWGPQIRFWHPVTSRFHVLVSATPFVVGLDGARYEYDERSGETTEISRRGFGALGATATFGARYARFVLSAELRGPSDAPHGVFALGPEFSLIRRMLNFKVAAALLWTEERTTSGSLFGLDSVF